MHKNASHSDVIASQHFDIFKIVFNWIKLQEIETKTSWTGVFEVKVIP